MSLLSINENTTDAPASCPTQTGNSTSCGCGSHALALAGAETLPEPEKPACNCQRFLWVRRVHAVCGLAFGVFLVEHLTATALGIRPLLLGWYLQFVHALLAWAPWLETLIFLPLLALLVFGLILLNRAGLRYQVKACKRGGPRRYFLQRFTAVVLLSFLAFHLLTLRNWSPRLLSPAPVPESLALASSYQAAFDASVAQVRSDSSTFQHAGVVAFYLLGTLAAVYHLTNGLWSGARAWGCLNTQTSQVWWRRACTAMGLLLAALGVLGWYAFLLA